MNHMRYLCDSPQSADIRQHIYGRTSTLRLCMRLAATLGVLHKPPKMSARHKKVQSFFISVIVRDEFFVFFFCFKHNYHIFTKRHVSLCNRQVATDQYVRIISVILCAESQHQRASQSMSLTQHETLLL